MRKIKVHLSVMRPNAFGGTTTTSLCGRLRTLSDGMNLTEHESEVTCAYCRAALEAKRVRKKP